MDFKDAIRELRRELGITQVELANALHINNMTISRWELGKSYPNRAVLSLLLGYAYTHSVPKSSIEALRKTVADNAKLKVKESVTVGAEIPEHISLLKFIETVPIPVYVCDIYDDSLLYANDKALEIIGLSLTNITEYKCYERIMHCNAACEYCNNSKLNTEEFKELYAKTEINGYCYSIQGMLISWNGHDARICRLLNATKM